MDNIKPFFTVGELRKAMEGLSYDQIIVPQVIGQKTGAWNMRAEFTRIVPQGTISAITLSHPDLIHLPNFPIVTPDEFIGYRPSSGFPVYVRGDNSVYYIDSLNQKIDFKNNS